jgi:hypothetical protein
MIHLAARARALGPGSRPVGIEEDLRIHGQDLGRLGVPYEVRPYLDLLCDAGKYSLVARAARHGAFFSPNQGPQDLLDSPGASAAFRVLESAGHGVLHLDIVSSDPEVEIVEPEPGRSSPQSFCVGEAGPAEMRTGGRAVLDEGGALRLSSGSSVRSPGFLVPAGLYAFSWRARGSRVAGAFARMRARVTAGADAGGPEVVKEGTFETNSFAKEFAVTIELHDEALVVLDLGFLDDGDAVAGDGRYVHLSSIRLLRLR